MTKTDFCKFLKITISLTLLSATLGCEEPKEKKANAGASSSPIEIEDALRKAIGNASILNAKEGQMVHYEENYRVDLQSVIKITDNIRELVQIKESPVTRVYVLNDLYREYDNAGTIVDEKFSETAIEFQKNPPRVASEFQAFTASNQECGEVRKSGNGKDYDCVGYYNFNSWTGEEDVPARTKLRPNCGNVPNCKLPVTVITFDRVYFYKGEIVDRETLNFSISKLIPMLFEDVGLWPFNYFCIGRTYDAGNTSYWVNRCTVLRDMQL